MENTLEVMLRKRLKKALNKMGLGGKRRAWEVKGTGKLRLSKHRRGKKE